MNVQDVFAEQFGELVGRGAQAAVYARGDIAVKVYRPGYQKEYVFYEAAIMAFVETTGLPVPKAYEVLCVHGQMALKMSRVHGRSLNQLMLAALGKVPEILDVLVDLQRKTQAQRILLQARLKHKLRALIAGNPELNAARKEKLLHICDQLPEGEALCHGDFHGDNILCQDGAYTIIDWIDASIGSPLGDACRTYLDYSFGDLTLAELYLSKYCAASGAKREDVLRWLPVQAGSMLGAMPPKFNLRLMECIDGA